MWWDVAIPLLPSVFICVFSWNWEIYFRNYRSKHIKITNQNILVSCINNTIDYGFKKKPCISHVHLKFGETLCPVSRTKFTDVEGRDTLRSQVLRIFQEIQRSHFTSYHPLGRATPFCVILSTVCEVLYFLSEVFWSLVQERTHLPPTLRYQRRFWGFS